MEALPYIFFLKKIHGYISTWEEKLNRCVLATFNIRKKIIFGSSVTEFNT